MGLGVDSQIATCQANKSRFSKQEMNVHLECRGIQSTSTF